MSDFSFLKEYVSPYQGQEDLSVVKHRFNPLEDEKINQVHAVFPIPFELKQFYRQVGYGFFYPVTDGLFNCLLSCEHVMEINKRDGVYEYDPDVGFYVEYYKGEKVLFFEIIEGKFFAIDKIDVNGKNPIYYVDKKVSDSLEEFLKHLDADQDLIKKIEEDN